MTAALLFVAGAGVGEALVVWGLELVVGLVWMMGMMAWEVDEEAAALVETGFAKVLMVLIVAPVRMKKSVEEAPAKEAVEEGEAPSVNCSIWVAIWVYGELEQPRLV
jgi:hypothetical protein